MQNFLQSGYIAERVLTASPQELIRMLYEGALSSVDLAIEMLRTKDVIARGRAITKAVNIIGELRASLREGSGFESASTLKELYTYMQNRLLEAHARKSEEPLREVSGLLRCLYEGWLGVMNKLAEAQVDEAFASDAFNLVADPYQIASSSHASCRSWQA